jgi:acyl carrier protein
MAEDDHETRFFQILSSMLNMPRGTLSRGSSRETVDEWDSLKHMHLVLAIEDEFGIEFDDAQVSELSSAGAMLDAILTKVRA